MELVIYSFAFLAVTLLVVSTYDLLFPRTSRVQQRLEELSQQSAAPGLVTGTVESVPPATGVGLIVEGVLTRVGRFFGSSKSSENLRQRLRKAGYYGDNAVMVYTGAEMLMGFLLPSIGVAVLSLLQISVLRFLLSVPLLGAVGFFLPSLYLSSRIS